jgi:hypothetical protein
LLVDPEVEAITASEMSANFYQTKQQSIPKESTLYTEVLHNGGLTIV